MKVRIEARASYLYAEVQGRESADDMRAFLTEVKQACVQHGQPRILISVRLSRPVFKAEDYGLGGEVRGYVNQLVTPSCRVALVGDSAELNHAHDYIALVARQQGVKARAFREPLEAARWLESEESFLQPGGSDFLQPAGAPKLP